MLELYVYGVGLFTPSAPNAAAWLDAPAEGQSEPATPTGSSLERRSRRMSSVLMRGFADVYNEACTQADFDAETVASVFGSALGEANTMIGLLDQMWAKHEEPSPMAFAASVHNAAAGVVSISNKNRAFTTSIAADFDTVAMALMEAVGLLATGHTEVMVACGDEPAPEKLVDDASHWGFLCGAVALRSAPKEEMKPLARLRVPTLGAENPLAFEYDAGLRANPQLGLLQLIDAVLRQRWGQVALDNGRGRGWAVEVLAP